MGENHAVTDTFFERLVVDDRRKWKKPVGHRLAEQQDIWVQPPLPSDTKMAETVIPTLNFIGDNCDVGIFGLFAYGLKPSGLKLHISPGALNGLEYEARNAGPINIRLTGRQHTDERIQRLPERRFLQGKSALCRGRAERIEAEAVKPAFDCENFARAAALSQRQRRAYGETAPYLKKDLEAAYTEGVSQPLSKSLGFRRVDSGDQIDARVGWKTNVFITMAEIYGPKRTA